MKNFLWSLVLMLITFTTFAQQTKKVTRNPLLKVDNNNIGEFKQIVPGVPSAQLFMEDEPQYNPQAGLPIFTKYKDGPKVKLRSEEGLPVWVEGKLPETQNLPAGREKQAFAYLQFIARQMQIREPLVEFNAIESHIDEQNLQHITFQQMIAGIEVYGAQIKVHLNPEGPVLMNGRYFPTPVISDFIPKVLAESSVEIVKNDVSRLTKLKNLNKQELSLVQNNVQVKQQLVIYHKDNNPYSEKLTWHVIIYPNITHRYEYFVDAITGEIIHSFENLCGIYGHNHHSNLNEDHCLDPLDGPTTANALDLNNKAQVLNTYQVGSKFYMIDASKSMFNGAQSVFPNNPVGTIVTLDGLNNSPSNNNFSYIIKSSNNNSWSDKASVSAHFNASECYKYFLSTFNRKSIDGKGGNIVSLVNITEDDGSGLDNAFWNGEAMFYGNGNSAFKPLAGGLDVGGHEMSHGVVQNTANLVYQGESGALNESYADVFGVLIDRNDWLLGEDIVKASAFPSGALRSMSDPHNGGLSLNDNGWQPKHTDEKYKGTQDNGGVHINSGIPNHAFFLFASNSNVGKDNAEKVYYKALTDYLVKSSVFIDARAAVVQAAKDLFGNSSPIVTAAESAFTQVGIGGGGNAGGSTYQNNLKPNPGNDFIVATDADPDKVYLTYDNNFSSIDVISDVDPATRFSVIDDGTAIVYVGTDKKLHAIQINYSNGNVNEVEINSNPIWGNVAISKDGSRLAMVTDAINNEITVYDYNLQKSQVFQLYNPTYSEGVQTGDVLYADALEWDYSGNYIMYDAYNEIQDQGGNKLHYWDIGFMRVFDKKKNTFGDGLVSKLYSGLPENTSIGNPTFSKNSPYIVAFDYIDEFENTNYLVGTNIETGDEDAVVNQEELFVPNYSRLDDYIIFNAPGDEIHAAKLGSNKISYGNSETTLFTDAKNGYWFGNGKREINIATHEQNSKSEGWSVYPSIVNGEVMVKAQKAHNNGLIQVINTMGSQMKVFSLDALNQGAVQKIDLGDLSPGTYFIRVQSGQNLQTEKIIKQ